MHLFLWSWRSPPAPPPSPPAPDLRERLPAPVFECQDSDAWDCFLFRLYSALWLPSRPHRSLCPAAGLVRLENRKNLILNAVPEAIVSGTAFCLPGQFPAVQPSNYRMHKNNTLITGAQSVNIREKRTWTALGIDNRNVLVNGIVKDALRYTKVNAG